MSQWTPPKNDDDVQLPFGINQTEPEVIEEAPPAQKKQRVNTSTLVLFSAFAAALMVLYGLGLRSKPRSANADEIAKSEEVKTAVSSLFKSPEEADQFMTSYRDTDKLLDLLNSYIEKGKVRQDDYSEDPFSSEPVVSHTTDNSSAPTAVVIDTTTADREKRAASFVQGLKLRTVMLGRVPAAMIDKRMVTVGAHIGELTVTTITAEGVILTCGNAKFDLKLPGTPLE